MIVAEPVRILTTPTEKVSGHGMLHMGKIVGTVNVFLIIGIGMMMVGTGNTHRLRSCLMITWILIIWKLEDIKQKMEYLLFQGGEISAYFDEWR